MRGGVAGGERKEQLASLPFYSMPARALGVGRGSDLGAAQSPRTSQASFPGRRQCPGGPVPLQLQAAIRARWSFLTVGYCDALLKGQH